MTNLLHVYGIKNCSTVKKALSWLEEHKIACQFHDFKKEGLSPETLAGWVRSVGWETLLNKRGTTFRLLSDEQKSNLTEQKACQLMLDKPSLIKRPVLEGKELMVGFDEELYGKFFSRLS
ncbi:ArsC family reductase [Acetobacteraceae bacterium ESL0709]|nr:ArsC family reductase [Acetobacteraceae bacterium ESL0697]MDF7677431.1 ArsC family reductase [Acetobacteraceae bacterium ESL0709]